MNTLAPHERPAQRQVTALRHQLAKLPQVPCPLDHEFTGKFYVRTIHVPCGTLVISKVFKEDFPFFISKGRVSIWIEGEGIVHRQAPFWGFTKAGTRRIIMHHTDVDWTTFHFVDQLRDVDEIEEQVVYDPETAEDSMGVPSDLVKQLKEAFV